MTPGTAAARRKTVTFGEHVNDNEEKRPTKSGLPDDCPGKFPSPWVKAGAADEQVEQPTEHGRGRGKLTEKLEQVREESAKRKKSERREKDTDVGDVVKEHAEPKSESGKYWKTQYDVYRENSQREVRKLIAKQKMAKSFAKDKDFQCTDLADQLRQEQKKVAKLEKKTAELEAQLKEVQARLLDREALERRPIPAAPANKPELGTRRSYRSEALKAAPGAEEPAATHQLQPSRDPPRELTQPPNEQRQLVAGAEQTRPDAYPQKGTAKARPINIRSKTSDDIWNLSFEPSSPALSRSAEQPPASPRHGRPVTSGTSFTPLKSLSINTLPTGKMTRRDSAQASPPVDRFANAPLVRQEVLPSPKIEERREASPVLSPGLPQPSPEQQSPKQREGPRSPFQRNSVPVENTDDISIQVPLSSPFQPNPMLSPPTADTKRSYFDRREQTAVKAGGSPISKENVSPAPKANPAVESAKPMAAWNAINAPTASKRVTSMTDKTGREVGLDRIEAAKARLAARGRNVS